MIAGFHPTILILLTIQAVLCGISYQLWLSSRRTFWIAMPGYIGLVASILGLFFGPWTILGGHDAALYFFFNISALQAVYGSVADVNLTDKRVKAAPLILYVLHTAAYFTENIFTFIVLWIFTIIPLVMENRKQNLSLLAFGHHVLSSLLLIVAAGILYFEKDCFMLFSEVKSQLEHGHLTQMAAIMLCVASFIRQGLFPFHLWFKSSVEINPFPINLSFYTGNLGFLLFFRIVIPLIEWDMAKAFPYLAIIAFGSSFYLANLALVQRRTRTSLFMTMLSQYSILYTGLLLHIGTATVAVFYQFMAVGLAFTGLITIVAFLEAHVGELQTRVFHGLQEDNPWMSILFLGFSLAAMGLPLTAAFVGEDILFHSLVEHHPLVGLGVIVTAAFNGFNIYRVYSYIFGGTRKSQLDAHVPCLTRHKLVLGAVFLAILVLGLIPGPFLAKIYQSL